MSYPTPIIISNLDTALADNSYDALVVVAENFSQGLPTSIQTLINKHAEFDTRVGSELVSIVSDEVAQKRLVLAPTGQLSRYFDDVRRYFDAAHKAAKVVLNMGAKKPLLVVLKNDNKNFDNAESVSYLGFC